MTTARIKTILHEAAKLPPAKARALVAAVCDRGSLKARDEAASTPDDLLEVAASAMQAAMELAILEELGRPTA
jgi:hypothetical protein